MAEVRSKTGVAKRIDVVAFALLIAGTIVTTVVLSHAPAATEDSVPSNLLGWPGAWLAEGLLDSLGIAVYVLLASWLVLVVALFLHRERWRWLRRLAGWMILIPGSAVIADQVG